MTAVGGVNGTVCNAQQYQQSLLSYNSRSPSITCLTHGQSIGLAFAAEASIFSCICVITIFICIGRNVHWYRKCFPGRDWKLFRGPADIYMFSLFTFDIVQATGGVLNVKWAHDGIVTTGHYCTAQGVIQQTGELGVALMALFLAVHTFVSAVFHVGLEARGVAFGLVCLACVFITLWVAIGAGIHKDYETPTPYWCSISPQFPGERLGGEYVWLWIALLASAMLYILLYFWLNGFWSIDEGYKFHWWNTGERVEYTGTIEYARRRSALGMLLYPIAYCIVILPNTVARYLQFSHHRVPSAATFFGTSMFHLFGAVDVALFLIARPGLLLFHRPKLDFLDEEEAQLELSRQSSGPGPETVQAVQSLRETHLSSAESPLGRDPVPEVVKFGSVPFFRAFHGLALPQSSPPVRTGTRQ